MAGVFNTIREKYSSVLLIVISLALGGFVLTDLFTSGRSIFGDGPPDDALYVGEVAGDKIRPDDVKIRANRDLYFKQISGQLKGEPTEMERTMAYNNAWERIVDEKAHQKEYDQLGIVVSDAEYEDMLFGSNPHPFVGNLFGSPDGLRSLLKQKDERSAFILSYFENDIMIPVQKQAKYESLLKYGIFVSKAEAQRRYAEENERRDVEFVGVSYAAVADSLVNVTDADLKNYYNEHREEYSQNQPEAIIKMAVLPKKATKEDSALAKKTLLDLVPKLQAAEDDSAFVEGFRGYSAQFKPCTWIDRTKAGDFSVQMNAAFTPVDSFLKIDPQGSPVYLENGAYKISKVSDKETNEKPGSHFTYEMRLIFVARQAAGAEDSLQKMAKAERIYNTINSAGDKDKKLEKFGEVARDSSDDKNTAQMGGMVNEFRSGMFGPEVDKALKDMPAGKEFQLLRPVATPGGFIVLYAKRVYDVIKLATIAYDLTPTEETITKLTQKADLLLEEIRKNPAGFDTIIAKAGLNVLNVPPLTPEARYIPGIQQGSEVKQVLRWAMTNEQGKVMDNALNLEKQIVIAYVDKKSERGFKSFEAVKEQVRAKVLAQKKAELIIAKLNTAKGDNLEAYKNAYGLGAYTADEKNLSFANPNLQGVRRPNAVGKAFALPVNKVSKPVADEDGVYVVKVTNITPANKLEAQALEDYRKNLQATKRNQYLGSARMALVERAEVKDYRYNHEF